MTAEAAAAAATASSSQPLNHSDHPCCCFCRHNCCSSSSAPDHHQHHQHDQHQHHHHHTGLPSPSDCFTSYASLVLFATSMAVIFAKAGIACRGQMHSFQYRRRGFYVRGQDRRERYFVRPRRSRWEWRPVNRRSAASQTTPGSSSLGIGSDFQHVVVQEFLRDRYQMIDIGTAKDTQPIQPQVSSFEDFPVLSRETLNSRNSTSGISSSRAPVNSKDTPAPSSPDPSADHYETQASSPSSEAEAAPKPLNRKQRKLLKKRQKTLEAASHTLHVTSLPVLKPWRSNNTSANLSSKVPALPKIYDSSKSLDPLSAPGSAKSVSPAKPHDYLSSIVNTASASTASPQDRQPTQEIIEISESLKSYQGDSTDSESLRKTSTSDPEEIGMDIPSLGSEFEADSEDYSFQPSAL